MILVGEEKKKGKEKKSNFETNIFYIRWLLLGICLFESKPVIFLILLSVPFHRNKGINVFEIRVETLLFKPMDKLTRYSVITPLKDPMRNLIGSFLSLSSPSLSYHSFKQFSTSSISKENSIRCMRITFDDFPKFILTFTSRKNYIQTRNDEISKWLFFKIVKTLDR